MDSRKSTFETLRGYSSRSRENFLPFFQVQDDKISSRKYTSRQRINTAKGERGHDGFVAVIEQEEEEKIDRADSVAGDNQLPFPILTIRFVRSNRGTEGKK